MQRESVFVVEDEESILELLSYNLIAGDGRGGCSRDLRSWRPRGEATTT